MKLTIFTTGALLIGLATAGLILPPTPLNQTEELMPRDDLGEGKCIGRNRACGADTQCCSKKCLCVLCRGGGFCT
ncbi:hypothetical protein F4778DRAFT_785951 [Xylariomycetidae sp. FL2044]|nr:hypothetical protein F4778DRAFT_785951 [Xylariomycetidae sp. FL2044]